MSYANDRSGNIVKDFHEQISNANNFMSFRKKGKTCWKSGGKKSDVSLIFYDFKFPKKKVLSSKEKLFFLKTSQNILKKNVDMSFVQTPQSINCLTPIATLAANFKVKVFT